MSAEKLINTLNKMVSLHRSLLELAKQKTEIIKKGDIEALSSILKDENKHVMAISKLEEERTCIVEKLVAKNDPTLTDVINLQASPEREQLIEIKDELSKIVAELKVVNGLNQELVHSSLQFVNYSMDLLMPRTSSINYNKPTNKSQNEQVKRSMFDSKA